jgi:hypothetical protein
LVTSAAWRHDASKSETAAYGATGDGRRVVNDKRIKRDKHQSTYIRGNGANASTAARRGARLRYRHRISISAGAKRQA